MVTRVFSRECVTYRYRADSHVRDWYVRDRARRAAHPPAPAESVLSESVAVEIKSATSQRQAHCDLRARLDQVANAVVDFHGRLGIERGRHSLEARRWVDAAAEMRDKVLETGAEGVDAAGHLGNETLDRAKSVTGKLSSGIAERALRRRGYDEKRDEEG